VRLIGACRRAEQLPEVSPQKAQELRRHVRELRERLTHYIVPRARRANLIPYGFRTEPPAPARAALAGAARSVPKPRFPKTSSLSRRRAGAARTSYQAGATPATHSADLRQNGDVCSRATRSRAVSPNLLSGKVAGRRTILRLATAEKRAPPPSGSG